MILDILSLSLAVMALILAYIALRVAFYRTGSHATAAKFAELEAEMTDQASAIDGVRLAMTKIRARLNAQNKRKRDRAEADEEEFDLNSEAGRTAARRALEARLASAGKLNSRSHRN